jgi:transposase
MDGGFTAAILLSPLLHLRTTDFLSKRWGPPHFSQLLRDQASAMPNSMPELLRLSRLTIDGLGQMNKQLLQALHTDQVLADRVQRLMTIPGVGQVLSLTWALEMGDITRFRSVKDAISYCG